MTGGVDVRGGRVTTTSLQMEAGRGNVDGHDIVHKFGRASVGTSFVPVAFGNVYQTPQVAGATALRIAAGDANDTAAGSGAREITLQGIDETGAEVIEAVATAGSSASLATSATFIRLYRFFVSASGTYATQIAGSHAADVVIENSAGGTTWGTIDATDFPRGQSEIAVYTIPNGFNGYIQNIYISVDSTRAADILLFKRESILDTAAPYQGMRAQLDLTGLSGWASFLTEAAMGPYLPNTDIGFMGKVSTGTGAIAIDYEIFLEPA